MGGFGWLVVCGLFGVSGCLSGLWVYGWCGLFGFRFVEVR